MEKNRKPFTYNLTDEEAIELFKVFHIVPVGTKIESIPPITNNDEYTYKLVPCNFTDGSCNLF